MAIKFGFRILFAVVAMISIWPAAGFSYEPPVAYIEKALASFDGIKDYTCLYIKQEKAIGNMEPQTIRLYFRKPFDVRMEWLNDKGKVDQTVVYREGFNNNKLRVKIPYLPVLNIDPNGSRGHGPGSDSMHPITELGIGRILRRVLNEIAKGPMAVNDLGTESVDGRNAHKIEVLSKAAPGVFFAKKTILWIDTETNFLVKHEHYNDKDELFERHLYKDIKINVGLGDDKFNL
ncbi:MAG TPA: DUF1571 domain-containing protein [Blastocatellia bacterium]|nr:DUF1571 domain-containing protein [Blastocatellia bacterium]